MISPCCASEKLPGPESIDLIVPDTMAALLSRMISLPSEAISFTGSIDCDCALAVATAGGADAAGGRAPA